MLDGITTNWPEACRLAHKALDDGRYYALRHTEEGRGELTTSTDKRHMLRWLRTIRLSPGVSVGTPSGLEPICCY